MPSADSGGAAGDPALTHRTQAFMIWPRDAKPEWVTNVQAIVPADQDVKTKPNMSGPICRGQLNRDQEP
ncbi:hypothetical protein ASE00_12905 [Sphingomonas sp. Root710]|uniref:hypothetical protein n=1 Tax=Sphingomonas sp. Root710 TaxID=1736594 RepID=UPI0006F3DF03|nr:hypothetical protein [Sphingomonas sp. Root710]KRB82896.1 hypothetical protein ASE00_12905 [Sphingomonas sp. Root710]